MDTTALPEQSVPVTLTEDKSSRQVDSSHISATILNALSALPDFRGIVDSTLAPPCLPNFVSQKPSQALRFKPDLGQDKQESSTNYHYQSNHGITKLDQLPEQLQSAFSSLFDLIIRNYVESWYLLPSVSTGDKAFLSQLRNALNHILLNAHAKLTTKSSKETMIYLIGCLSMNVVRELNNRANSKSQISSQDRIAQRLTQTRRISEEILLTLGSPSITSSPLTLNLASEVLTVQLISITKTYNSDWFNKTLIDSLGTGTPTQVSLAATSTKATSAAVTAAVVDQIKENSKQNRSLFSSPSPSPSRSHSANDVPQSVAATPDDIRSVTGNDVLIAYLKSPTNFNLSVITKPNCTINLQNLFEHTSKWAPQSGMTDSGSSSLLSPSSHDLVQVECLVKLFNHFDSFHKTCQSANLKPDLIKVDAISVLSALAPLMDYTVDQHIASQSNQSSKDQISSTWKSVIVETLRRLELSQLPAHLSSETCRNGSSINYAPSNRTSQIQLSAVSGPETNLDIEYQPWATTAPGSTREGKIHYMTLPNIPEAGSAGYTVESPPMQSQDLASSRDDHTWDKAKNSTTEAILNRHRAPSVTRVSPSSAGFGASPRKHSTQENFGSPSATLPSSAYSTRVPEGGYDRSSTNMLPISDNSQPASFSVSVTDMSPPSVTDPKTGLIKQKKDISLLIAVEASFVPGFIVTRGWPEIERMDLAINKKKLVGVGTKAFPRALLPTNLNFKTIDHVRRELEAYLKCLLNDERYSKSEPVLKFFAKERSGMSGRGGAINNILNSTSSTLDSIGKGVASVGKEVVSKPVDFATLGLNRLSKGVFSGLPFGNSTTPTREGNEESASLETGSRRGSLQRANSTKTNLTLLEPFNESNKTAEGLVKTPTRNDAHQSDGNREERLSYHSPTKGTREEKSEQQSVAARNPESTSGPRSTSDVSTALQTRHEKDHASNLTSQSPVYPQRSRSVGMAPEKKQEPWVASNFTETVKPATASPDKSIKPTVPSNGKTKSLPASSIAATTTLSGKEFDTVIIGMISILEAAYGLDQKQGGSGNNTPWSMKRGVLRVLETILRTTSFSDFIRLTLSQIIDKFEKVETYVDLINSVLLSLPSSSSTPEEDDQRGTGDDNEHQNYKNKRKLRPRKSFSSLVSEAEDSSDNLSLDLSSSRPTSPSSPSSSTDTQSNQYQYQSLVDDEDDKKSDLKLNHQSKTDRLTQVKQQRKDAARKLFVESWSNLKIGLGSNATDLAANKVFDLFQEFDDPKNINHQQQEVGVVAEDSSDLSNQDKIKRRKNNNDDDNNHLDSSVVQNLPSGIEFIVHNLLLDLIRIILLL
ncbi:hypothetical protein PSTT_16602 [Puccinia striiformis]|uniref:PXA domain-containing protein n=1 Tax=Puccinia striiformis TaxID=27350 RepID=A0A2S4UC70_9BASI|nr:hypothetical protein PSTT_16602 [Puccinia striiformis]